MKPSKLYEALHALIGERVLLHIWGACGVGKRLCQSVWDCTIGKHQNHRVNSKRPISSRPILIGGESCIKDPRALQSARMMKPDWEVWKGAEK